MPSFLCQYKRRVGERQFSAPGGSIGPQLDSLFQNRKAVLLARVQQRTISLSLLVDHWHVNVATPTWQTRAVSLVGHSTVLVLEKSINSHGAFIDMSSQHVIAATRTINRFCRIAILDTRHAGYCLEKSVQFMDLPMMPSPSQPATYLTILILKTMCCNVDCTEQYNDHSAKQF